MANELDQRILALEKGYGEIKLRQEIDKLEKLAKELNGWYSSPSRDSLKTFLEDYKNKCSLEDIANIIAVLTRYRITIDTRT